MTPIDAESLPAGHPGPTWTGRALSVVILALATAFGIGAFIYPFLAPSPRTPQSAQQMFAHSQDAPFIFLATIVLCLIVVVINLETKRMNSKVIAVLGIMVAINAILRLVPGFVGFSAMFFLPILCGYAYGADFGFLLGALSLLVSAVVTNGMGPWLPYQMFAAGWMGMAAAWLPDLSRLRWVETAVLSVYGAVLGLVFGAVMDLWFWPYLFDPQQLEALLAARLRATVGGVALPAFLPEHFTVVGHGASGRQPAADRALRAAYPALAASIQTALHLPVAINDEGPQTIRSVGPNQSYS